MAVPIRDYIKLRLEALRPNVSDFPLSNIGYSFYVHREIGNLQYWVKKYIHKNPDLKSDLFKEIEEYKIREYSGSKEMQETFLHLLESLVYYPYHVLEEKEKPK